MFLQIVVIHLQECMVSQKIESEQSPLLKSQNICTKSFHYHVKLANEHISIQRQDAVTERWVVMCMVGCMEALFPMVYVIDHCK
jgi:hypothetical protein